jgi:mannose-6-phosphate isomerase-like protein (cupin superfamily)
MTIPWVFDLSSTFVHLGLGGTATELPDFEWTADFLDRYEAETRSDGPDSRLVVLSPQEEHWSTWERHPAGEEVVIQMSGRAVLIQDLPDGENRCVLDPGHAVINPRGVWHTSDVLEPGMALFITPGFGTEHRPR